MFTQLSPAFGFNTLECSGGLKGDISLKRTEEGKFCCLKQDDPRINMWGNQCNPRNINGLLKPCAGHPLIQSGDVTTDLDSPYRNIMGFGVSDELYGRVNDSINIYPEWVLYPLKAGFPAA